MWFMSLEPITNIDVEHPGVSLRDPRGWWEHPVSGRYKKRIDVYHLVKARLEIKIEFLID